MGMVLATCYSHQAARHPHTSDVNGALDVVLNNSMIPPTSKFRLNTTDWKDLIPQLYAEFPNKAMQVRLYWRCP